MQKCRILDDQYGEKIYQEIKHLFPDWEYPVKKNILTPMIYLDQIQDGDLILLDNYFPGTGREEALGDEFLGALLEKEIKVKVLCISDYGERLLERYEYWGEAHQKGVVIGFVKSKDGFEIGEYLMK